MNRQQLWHFLKNKVFPVVVVSCLILIFSATAYSLWVKARNPDLAVLDLSEVFNGDSRFVTDVATYNSNEIIEQYSIIDLEPRHYMTRTNYLVSGTYRIMRIGLWGHEKSEVTFKREWLAVNSFSGVVGELVIRVPYDAFKSGIFEGYYK